MDDENNGGVVARQFRSIPSPDIFRSSPTSSSSPSSPPKNTTNQEHRVRTPPIHQHHYPVHYPHQSRLSNADYLRRLRPSTISVMNDNNNNSNVLSTFKACHQRPLSVVTVEELFQKVPPLYGSTGVGLNERATDPQPVPRTTNQRPQWGFRDHYQQQNNQNNQIYTAIRNRFTGSVQNLNSIGTNSSTESSDQSSSTTTTTDSSTGATRPLIATSGTFLRPHSISNLAEASLDPYTNRSASGAIINSNNPSRIHKSQPAAQRPPPVINRFRSNPNLLQQRNPSKAAALLYNSNPSLHHQQQQEQQPPPPIWSPHPAGLPISRPGYNNNMNRNYTPAPAAYYSHQNLSTSVNTGGNYGNPTTTMFSPPPTVTTEETTVFRNGPGGNSSPSSHQQDASTNPTPSSYAAANSYIGYHQTAAAAAATQQQSSLNQGGRYYSNQALTTVPHAIMPSNSNYPHPYHHHHHQQRQQQYNNHAYSSAWSMPGGVNGIVGSPPNYFQPPPMGDPHQMMTNGPPQIYGGIQPGGGMMNGLDHFGKVTVYSGDGNSSDEMGDGNGGSRRKAKWKLALIIGILVIVVGVLIALGVAVYSQVRTHNSVIKLIRQYDASFLVTDGILLDLDPQLLNKQSDQFKFKAGIFQEKIDNLMRQSGLSRVYEGSEITGFKFIVSIPAMEVHFLIKTKVDADLTAEELLTVIDDGLQSDLAMKIFGEDARIEPSTLEVEGTKLTDNNSPKSSPFRPVQS